jgi:phospholipid/cholesterol/gamma-HCH transport system substrate-binding protein
MTASFSVALRSRFGEIGMRLTGDLIVRAAALAAVLVVAIVVAVLLLRSPGGDYKVKARFQNAAQLVKGNLVQTGGAPIGTVETIDLTPDGQAEVTMKIKDDFVPLRRGTLATIRQASLSGVANRYIDLRMAPQSGEKIPSGGVIEQDSTTTAVDLDALFNTFDPQTRKALSGVIRGSAAQVKGKGKQFNEGIAYLNPSLAASSRLFRELNRDTPLLERFIVSSSQLVTDIADRRDDLAGLVDELATTTTAIGNQKAALAESIGRLPGFQRRANTTFVNLRAALDDLDPLVNDSKPVAKKLRPFLAELRPLARDARPTLNDLSDIVKRPGAANDLIELTNLQVPLRDVTTRKVQANGKQRDGAFKASQDALKGNTPEFAFFRPYTPDLLGWFDDFSHSGIYDALGAASRVGVHANAFALTGSGGAGQYELIPPQLRGPALQATLSTRQNNRCPGGGEHKTDDGSGPYKPTPDFSCDPSQVLPGK